MLGTASYLTDRFILISLVFLSAQSLRARPLVVSPMNQKDAEFDPQAESTYECFDCGTVVRATAPDACPECGAEMRNRRTPIE
ncbi:hypothetical protein JCM9743_36900 [Natrinema sp. JCM 9743]